MLCESGSPPPYVAMTSYQGRPPLLTAFYQRFVYLVMLNVNDSSSTVTLAQNGLANNCKLNSVSAQRASPKKHPLSWPILL